MQGIGVPAVPVSDPPSPATRKNSCSSWAEAATGHREKAGPGGGMQLPCPHHYWAFLTTTVQNLHQDCSADPPHHCCCYQYHHHQCHLHATPHPCIWWGGGRSGKSRTSWLKKVGPEQVLQESWLPRQGGLELGLGLGMGIQPRARLKLMLGTGKSKT